MILDPYAINFGYLGTSLDLLLSELREHAANYIPTTENIKNNAEIVKSNVVNTVPRIIGDFNVDLCETDSSIIVVCDIPGVDKDNISVKLLNENTLNIETKCDNSADEYTLGRYHLRERRTESGHRTIRLPVGVTAEGARASFKNGIMEVTLPKLEVDKGVSIEIE